MKVSIASDHAGFTLKKSCIDYLESAGYTVQDFGPHSDESVDYPDFAHQVAAQVAKDSSVIGILICGSANGVAMTANKYQEVRACLSWRHEIAELGRLHNNANILCLPARFMSDDEAFRCVNVFLNTPFEGGRHERRVSKIKCCI